MSRRKRSRRNAHRKPGNVQIRQNSTVLRSVFDWLFLGLFNETRFHGNVKWKPESLVQQALIWAWQETPNVTDSFDVTLEACEVLGIKKGARTYTAFLDALVRYQRVFSDRLRQRFQTLAEQVAGRFWRQDGWVLLAFDGSRATTPRTASNERAFCAPNYGKGSTAKYRKKKSKGMRLLKNEKNKPQPQEPQLWITMVWHMGLRLPWTWRLGPSNSSERQHVTDMLGEEDFPKNTLFCGDAGFVGYDFWHSILDTGQDFLVRVGGNVSLLSEQVDFHQLRDNRVLCWPKNKRSKFEPLELRLVKVIIGKTKMWMLTSVLDKKNLSKKQIVRTYKARWGVEVEFRGLKQTIDKAKLRCRNSERVYVEMDWSIRAMAIAELLAFREQIDDSDRGKVSRREYDPKDRSLSQTIRALRRCLRLLHSRSASNNDLLVHLSKARVQRYQAQTSKKARYRPPNPDKKPLGAPKINRITSDVPGKRAKISDQTAA